MAFSSAFTTLVLNSALLPLISTHDAAAFTSRKKNTGTNGHSSGRSYYAQSASNLNPPPLAVAKYRCGAACVDGEVYKTNPHPFLATCHYCLAIPFGRSLSAELRNVSR